MRVQQFVRTADVPDDSQKDGKYAPPLVDFVNAEKSQQMKQVQLPPFHAEMDEQRAHEMEQLESDIVQVNELFTTLATYVHDQGTMVDSIGQNIEVAYEKVEAGTQQLDNAVKQCRSARRKKCICLLVVFAVLVVIAIVLGVSLHK
ncbi:Syntaxin-12 [Fasciola hepatica]|uniref:Syntaxin-12 n=1 Tax=Fasciola hepatica TaxID=6192 RepID=A0A4E0R1N7_FASHE|nr:Syntaxin-12 [Fasciola hepatica]